MTRPIRLAYLVSHPIQYQAPLLRHIAADPTIDLTVLFGSDLSTRPYRDPGFNRDIIWDTPLLTGYPYKFLPTLRDTGRISATNPISRGLYTRLKSGRFDALWVHGYASINSLQAIAAARLLGIPVLLRAESWLADRIRSPLKLAAKRAFFQLLSPFIAAVLPIGTRNAAYWQHYLPNTPQFPMPYAVDNDWFARQSSSADTQQLRAELNLAPNRPVILFASKLQPRKHADHLIAAYRNLLTSKTGAPHLASEMWEGTTTKTSPTPYLLIIGDGEDRPRLEALASGLEGVRFLGFRNQSELPAWFALADIFVLPSRHEPWGLIVNEALASGCPAIVSDDCGCAPDLITPTTGLTYPVGDIPALTAALQHILTTSPTLRPTTQHHMTTWSFNEDLTGLQAALAHITNH
jgi:glycosyltransferase involved in cell wall biosynthesis